MNRKPDVLSEIGQIYLSELETLPLAELFKLENRINAAEAEVCHYKQIVQSVKHHRFSQRAQQLRQQAGKTTGTVRFQDDGFTVVADQPKRVEYDQRKLKDAVEALRKWGEDPEDYVSLEIKVSETKYGAWPPAVRELFEPARTLKIGKPTYKLERIEAANDSQFGEP